MYCMTIVKNFLMLLIIVLVLIAYVSYEVISFIAKETYMHCQYLRIYCISNRLGIVTYYMWPTINKLSQR
jgi:hypothetical protein